MKQHLKKYFAPVGEEYSRLLQQARHGGLRRRMEEVA